MRVFDFDEWHCNIVRPRDVSAAITYVTKEGSFIEHGSRDSISPSRSTWATVLTARSRSEAEQIISSSYPRDLVINLERVEYFLNKKFAPQAPVYQPRPAESFTTPQTLSDWVGQRCAEGILHV